MKVEIKEGTVFLTETDVYGIVKAIEKAREITPEFIDEPMPDGDMDSDTYRRLKRERGEIFVSSSCYGISFSIILEQSPNSQESIGFRLIE